MFYQFPYIDHIDDVLEAINGVEGILVMERPDFNLIHYAYMSPELMPPVTDRLTAIRRECRGIMFDKEGKIISRPYHKFFNMNERAETLSSNLPIDAPHVILDKADGSMIRPVKINGKWRLATKMGFSEVAERAEKWIRKSENAVRYAPLLASAEEQGLTLLFEYVGPQNRIILEYPEEDLILTAARNMYTGEYLTYEQLVTAARLSGINCIQRYFDLELEGLENTEGRVVAFENGHRVKVKTDWYILHHKSKDSLLREKDIIDLLVNEKADDLKSALTADDRQKFEDFELDFWAEIQKTSRDFLKEISYLRREYSTRKDFALTTEHVEPLVKTFVFKLWDAEISLASVRALILEHLRNNTGTQSKVDSVRHLFGSIRWEYNFNEDN